MKNHKEYSFHCWCVPLVWQWTVRHFFFYSPGLTYLERVKNKNNFTYLFIYLFVITIQESLIYVIILSLRKKKSKKFSYFFSSNMLNGLLRVLWRATVYFAIFRVTKYSNTVNIDKKHSRSFTGHNIKYCR